MLGCSKLVHCRGLLNRYPLFQRKIGGGRLYGVLRCCAVNMGDESCVSESRALPKVLIITGPTAVGKTNLSLQLAEKLNGEIISADSVQVYRGLDVGSDKISVEDRRGIPHHLIDVLEPFEEFSAGHFHDAGQKLIKEILERNRTPIVVGGTGFYLKFLIHGKPDTMQGSPELRQEVEEKLEQVWAEAETRKGSEITADEKWEAGVRLLAEAGDEEAAARIVNEKNNYYRLTRALEVVLGTGRAMSELDITLDAPLEYDFRGFFLYRPRLQLFDRIGERCEEMIVNGLLEEAKMLLDKGLEPNQNCATRAIGYRQAMEFLKRLDTKEVELTDEALLQFILGVQTATRNLVKQQMKWFRQSKVFQWVDVSNYELDVEAHILTKWNNLHHEGGAVEDMHHLTKEQQYAIKCFQPKLTRLKDPESRLLVLNRLRDLIGVPSPP